MNFNPYRSPWRASLRLWQSASHSQRLLRRLSKACEGLFPGSMWVLMEEIRSVSGFVLMRFSEVLRGALAVAVLLIKSLELRVQGSGCES